MSDGQTLYLILVLVYLSDCWIWISRRSVAFCAPWLRKWIALDALAGFSNAWGGLILLNPLPPLGSVFLGHLSPISISPNGVSALNLSSIRKTGRPPHSDAYIEHAKISDVSVDGSALIINGKRFARAGSPQQAHALARVIASMRNLSADARCETIRRFVADQFSWRAATDIKTEVDAAAAELRYGGMIFFLFLFIAIPFLAHMEGLGRSIIPFAASLYVASILTAIRFYRAHKRFYPSFRHDRLVATIVMALCPPAAIRVADRLSAEALSIFHPVLIAGLLSGEAARGFAQSLIRDMRHPLGSEGFSEEALETAKWYNASVLEGLLNFIQNNKAQEILLAEAPPAPRDGCIAYCPRCGEQYLSMGRECPECAGVVLMLLQEFNMDLIDNEH